MVKLEDVTPHMHGERPWNIDEEKADVSNCSARWRRRTTSYEMPQNFYTASLLFTNDFTSHQVAAQDRTIKEKDYRFEKSRTQVRPRRQSRGSVIALSDNDQRPFVTFTPAISGWVVALSDNDQRPFVTFTPAISGWVIALSDNDQRPFVTFTPAIRGWVVALSDNDQRPFVTFTPAISGWVVALSDNDQRPFVTFTPAISTLSISKQQLYAYTSHQHSVGSNNVYTGCKPTVGIKVKTLRLHQPSTCSRYQCINVTFTPAINTVDVKVTTLRSHQPSTDSRCQNSNVTFTIANHTSHRTQSIPK